MKVVIHFYGIVIENFLCLLRLNLLNLTVESDSQVCNGAIMGNS